MKTAIVIDSTFYLPHEISEKYGLYTVPLTVNFENVSYKENINDDKLLRDIFKRVKEEKVLPKSSQPGAQDYLNKFDEIKAKGFDRVVVFTISSKLSGTFQGATIAASMYMEEHAGINIEVYDSKNVAQPAAIAVMELAKMITKNPEISNNEIETVIDHYSQNSRIYLMVDSLDFLSYGGRIPSSIAAIGNIFGIKPVLEVKEGEILEFKKVRSTKKRYKLVLDLYEEAIKDNPELIKMYATHADAEKEIKKLYKVAKEKSKAVDSSFELIELGPVIAIHVGPGAIGFGWTKKYQG